MRTALGILTAACVLAPLAAAAPARSSGSWRDDPAWHAGKAEWALYESSREIYGQPRRSETTIFTNKQRMDPRTTTKAGDEATATIEVFKHNVSEVFPAGNYDYRFLTTCFVRTDALKTYKLVASTQEDCGATYKQLVVDGDRVRATSHCYFPDAGETTDAYPRPGSLAFHDALTLTLRDYPFDAADKPAQRLQLVADQTDTHQTPARPADATVRYVERTTVEVPYGAVDCHHLRVEHAEQGGTTESHYWFAADAETMRHVLVKYDGPYGVTYALKRLDWWAYWREPRPE